MSLTVGTRPPDLRNATRAFVSLVRLGSTWFLAPTPPFADSASRIADSFVSWPGN